MTETEPRRGARGVRAAAAVSVAGLAVNALGYVVPLLGARILSPGDVGALGTVLALGALVGVVGLGVQTAVAVRRAQAGAVRAGKLTAAVAAIAAGGLVAATPLIATALDLSAWLPPLLGAMMAAVIVGCRWLGEAQGAQRFPALAVGMVLSGLARFGGIILGLSLGAGVVGAVAVGAAVAWMTVPVLRRLIGGTRDGRRADAGPIRDGGLGRAIVAASSANLAMLTISYADLLLARYFLSAADSGTYVVGAVLTKGALWAPAVVTLIALPRLARGNRRTLPVAALVVAACGGVLVLASAFAGELAVRLAGGPAYDGLAGSAWLFALSGALYALVFLFVNARIAAGARRPGLVLWIGALALVVAVAFLRPPTIDGIITIAVITAAVMTVIMGILAARRPGGDAAP